jgi:hypothetical protein
MFSLCRKPVFENNKTDQNLIGLVVLLNVLKISDNEYLKGFTAGLVESAPQVSWRARTENLFFKPTTPIKI